MSDYEYAPFSGFGVEIEYMIVDRATLAVSPTADRLLDAVGGAADMDVERGSVAWSNELALHVIEMKTNGPTSDLSGAAHALSQEVCAMNEILAGWGAMLLPTGMHPFMDPNRETKLWPHNNSEIYSKFDEIFDCRGHGWSNLQSTHINFPFQTDEQFGRLHAACRAVLPLLPALAASSPYWEGRRAPGLDQRLFVYEKNCARVPSVTGKVVPEPITTRAHYESLLRGIYDDLAPLDPDGVLAEEWVNARGAIARFDRGAIEIRVLDCQECPAQDFHVVRFVSTIVRKLFDGTLGDAQGALALDTGTLHDILYRCASFGTETRLPDDYLRVIGSEGPTAGDALFSLATLVEDPETTNAIQTIARGGNLAERLTRRLGDAPERRHLTSEYARLAQCLESGSVYEP